MDEDIREGGSRGAATNKPNNIAELMGFLQGAAELSRCHANDTPEDWSEMAFLLQAANTTSVDSAAS